MRTPILGDLDPSPARSASQRYTLICVEPATPTKEMKVLHEMLLEAESLLTRHIEISGERAVTTRNVKRKVDSDSQTDQEV